jgi:PAS domain S-box-containing protein
MWQYTPYIMPLAVVAGTCALLAVIGWRRRPSPGAAPFAMVMFGAAIFSAAYAVEWACVPIDGKMAANFVEYCAIGLVPGGWLVFVLRYTGRDRRLSRQVLLCLAIEPVLTLLLILTNNWHHLYYTRVWSDFVGPYAALGLEHGVGFYLHTIYSYIFMALANFWLVRTLWRSASVYRGQVVALLCGAFTPWFAGMTYVFQLSPWPRLDLTPFGLAGTGLAVGWAILQERFLDIVPVAREAIFENMADGMIALDSQGRVAYANPAARSMLDLIGPERWAAAEARTELSVGAGAARRDFDVRRSPLRDAPGRADGQLIELRDVTAPKAAEEALRVSEARYRNIVETTAEGIWVLAPDATTRFVNQRMADMLRYTAAEMLGRPMIEFVPEDERPALSRALAEGLDRPPAARGDLRFRRKDGSDLWAIVDGSPMYGPQGRFDGVTALLTDVTDRKRLEDELRRHREHLAELVSERTAALRAANEQLQREIVERESAESRVRAALAEKDVLLKEIHHRVKNNLQVIASLLYLQSKDLAAPAAVRMFADSQHRVRSMALVHERLYRSSDLAHIDFAGYVRALGTHLVRAYATGATRLVVDVPDDVQLGIDLAVPCGLIVNELLSNALKHAFPGADSAPGVITVALKRDAAGRLRLSVRDNGVGLPREVDFEAPASLGLQLVHMLARQLGGTVELVPGAGTEVRVTLV